MKRFTNDAFKVIASEFNKMRTELGDKVLTTKELIEALKIYGFPCGNTYMFVMAEHGIFNKEGFNKWSFPKNPVFWEDYKKAYESFRSKGKSYKKNHPVVSSTVVKVTSAEEAKNSKEACIQEAIKLLKAQGDRFTITEKIVKIEYKEL